MRRKRRSTYNSSCSDSADSSYLDSEVIDGMETFSSESGVDEFEHGKSSPNKSSLSSPSIEEFDEHQNETGLFNIKQNILFQTPFKPDLVKDDIDDVKRKSGSLKRSHFFDNVRNIFSLTKDHESKVSSSSKSKKKKKSQNFFKRISPFRHRNRSYYDNEVNVNNVDDKDDDENDEGYDEDDDEGEIFKAPRRNRYYNEYSDNSYKNIAGGIFKMNAEDFNLIRDKFSITKSLSAIDEKSIGLTQENDEDVKDLYNKSVKQLTEEEGTKIYQNVQLQNLFHPYISCDDYMNAEQLNKFIELLWLSKIFNMYNIKKEEKKKKDFLNQENWMHTI
ncbi:hypothetical protein, conserved [Plasmodium malariae]|uniref:Uncharacterized protein n=1 Tax=Plasmodium malariae TaxID=5858 RepID=A0A1C3KYU1_PLAMA|nr:hypothetical protein, conserved [Plasmodium malariae]